MDQKMINARARTALGKEATKRLRKSGRLPVVACDRTGTSVSMDVDEKEFLQLYRGITDSTIVNVKEEGSDFEAFIKNVEFDIVSGRPIHADFYKIERGKILRTKVGIKFIGSPAGVREGGVFETGVTEIDVECLPKDLPTQIELDVSDLGTNQSVHVRDLQIPADVKVHTAEDQVVATIRYV